MFINMSRYIKELSRKGLITDAEYSQGTWKVRVTKLGHETKHPVIHLSAPAGIILVDSIRKAA